MEEIWKPIEGYENIYEISTLGNIRSIDHMVLQKVGNTVKLYNYLGRELKSSITKSGSRRITLNDGVRKRTHNLAKLVAKNFIDCYSDDKQLIHINGDKSDCKLSNLRCI